MAGDTRAEGMVGKEVLPQTGNAARSGRVRSSHHVGDVCCWVQAWRGGAEPIQRRGRRKPHGTEGSDQLYVYVSSMGTTGGSGVFAM